MTSTATSDATRRRSARHAGALSASNGPVPPATPATPASSPCKDNVRDHNFDPRFPTPDAARVFNDSGSAPHLNTEERRAVDELYTILDLANRCALTGEAVSQYTHLVPRSTSYEQLLRLTHYLGWQLPTDDEGRLLGDVLDINRPENIIKLGPTEHYQSDHKQLVPIPKADFVTKVCKTYEEFYAKNPGVKPPPFEELFSPLPKTRPFGLLPLDIDQKKKIFCHRLKKTGHGVYESTGEYDPPHAWPYDNIEFPTHAHPLLAMWHAAEEMYKLGPHRLRVIMDQLKEAGASDLVRSMLNINRLGNIWRVPDAAQPAAVKPVNAVWPGVTHAADQPRLPARLPPQNQVDVWTDDEDLPQEPDVAEDRGQPLLPLVFVGKELVSSKQSTTETDSERTLDVSQSETFGSDLSTIYSAAPAPANAEGKSYLYAMSSDGHSNKAKRKISVSPPVVPPAVASNAARPTRRRKINRSALVSPSPAATRSERGTRAVVSGGQDPAASPSFRPQFRFGDSPIRPLSLQSGTQSDGAARADSQFPESPSPAASGSERGIRPLVSGGQDSATAPFRPELRFDQSTIRPLQPATPSEGAAARPAPGERQGGGIPRGPETYARNTVTTTRGELGGTIRPGNQRRPSQPQPNQWPTRSRPPGSLPHSQKPIIGFPMPPPKAPGSSSSSRTDEQGATGRRASRRSAGSGGEGRTHNQSGCSAAHKPAASTHRSDRRHSSSRSQASGTVHMRPPKPPKPTIAIGQAGPSNYASSRAPAPRAPSNSASGSGSGSGPPSTASGSGAPSNSTRYSGTSVRSDQTGRGSASDHDGTDDAPPGNGPQNDK